MLILRISSVFLLISLSLSASALEVGKTYIRADLGYSKPTKFINHSFFNEKPLFSKKPDSSPLYGLGFGYKFNEHLRSEFAVTHRVNYKYNTLSTNQKYSSTSIMMNGYYDFKEIAKFRPYVLIGLGVSLNNSGNLNRTDAEGDNVQHKGQLKKSRTWQVGTGVMYPLSNNLFFDVSYRFVDLGKFYTASRDQNRFSIGAINSKMKSHDLLCSISFNFK